MENTIFENTNYSVIEQNVLSIINSTPSIIDERSLNNPRAIGDAIKTLLESKFASALPSDLVKSYNPDFARRSMADFAFEDINGNYYVVDCTTHNIDTEFNMPNLTSVERISRFYEDKKNFFTILLIRYSTNEGKVKAEQCFFLPIEHLKWLCLTVGALGWGQIQISDAKNIQINRLQSRKDWMIQLCDQLEGYYPKEIEKAHFRLAHFQSIRNNWISQPD